MANYHGDIHLGDTLDIQFTSTSGTTGAPTTLSGSPVISAYIGNSTTQLTAGITLTVDLDGVTGLNNVRIVASSGNGYAAATNVSLVITTGTVGGTSAVGYTVGAFSIDNRPVNATQLAGQTITAAAGVTFPSSVASPTNITAGTIATVTNLTNAPTAGDFTATMKTSIGTAVAASAVASVTGNVGGNVTGSVGSIASGGITAASIASAAFTAAKFAADTGLVPIRSNTAQAGAATTITLDASANANNNFYNNCLILLTGGTGAGQSRFITAYVGSAKVATVATWVTNPDNTSTFAILPFDAVAGATAPTAAQIATAIFQDLTATSDFTTVGSFGKLVVDNLNATITSRMATYTQPTGFLAATFPTGTIANTTNITAGTIATVTNLTNAPGAGDFTATMKTSIGTAVAASAVASVTGNVGGNVVGSVASVTGAVGSVAGNVGGNVTGSVGSVVGAVGSVTGAVGSVTAVVSADMKKINGTTVNGDGSGTPWGP